MVDDSIVLLDDSTAAPQNSTLFEAGFWLDRLKERLLGLGKELYGRGADYVFPVEFLVAALEGTFLFYRLNAQLPFVSFCLLALLLVMSMNRIHHTKQVKPFVDLYNSPLSLSFIHSYMYRFYTLPFITVALFAVRTPNRSGYC